MPGNYKTIFRGMKWDFCYHKELPWEEIYIDCDSIIFKYMLEYIRNDLNVSYETVGANIFSTKLMTDAVIDNISKYCHNKLKGLLNTGIRYVIVFGGGWIETKQKRIEIYSRSSTEAYKELRTISKNNPDKLRRSLCKYIVSNRDRIRDLVKGMMNEHYIVCEEPDIYCSQNSMATVSSDYDLFLFGAKYIIKDIQEDKIIFLSRERLLKNIGLYNMRQLVTASVLCGTDYNTGIKGIGPKKSINMALNDPDSDIIDVKSVNFFLDVIEHSYNESSY